MDLNKLAAQFPRSFRLIADQDISVAEGNEFVTDYATSDNGGVWLSPADGAPTVLIGLRNLERALTGFRDTGTWGDYFPPADTDPKDPKLTVPSRPGNAQYQIDTDDGADEPK